MVVWLPSAVFEPEAGGTGVGDGALGRCVGGAERGCGRLSQERHLTSAAFVARL
jgi:hypothetical protein